MTLSPSVSVIVPLFNKGPYLLRCLESIFAQTLCDMEILVIDDGSTDDGPRLAASQSDRRLRVIRQENAGPGAARNRGLREATAPIVSFLDADDEWLPSFLEHSVGLLNKHPQCVAVVTGGFEGPERRDRFAKYRRLGVETGVWEMPVSLEPEKFKAAIDFFALGTTTAYREILLRYGGFYERVRCNYGEDANLWIQVAMNHRVYRDSTPLTWIHTEASQLGAQRKTVRPPWPFLLDPQSILLHCPPAYRPLWQSCLPYYALIAARRHARVGDVATAWHLHRRYHLRKAFGFKNWHYRQLWLELARNAWRRWAPHRR